MRQKRKNHFIIQNRARTLVSVEQIKKKTLTIIECRLAFLQNVLIGDPMFHPQR